MNAIKAIVFTEILLSFSTPPIHAVTQPDQKTESECVAQLFADLKFAQMAKKLPSSIDPKKIALLAENVKSECLRLKIDYHKTIAHLIELTDKKIAFYANVETSKKSYVKCALTGSVTALCAALAAIYGLMAVLLCEDTYSSCEGSNLTNLFILCCILKKIRSPLFLYSCGSASAYHAAIITAGEWREKRNVTLYKQNYIILKEALLLANQT